jgi:hypothetical protein
MNIYYYQSIDTKDLQVLEIPLKYCDGDWKGRIMVHETPFTYFPFAVRGGCDNYMMVQELDDPLLRGLGGDSIKLEKRLLNVDNFTNYYYLANGVKYDCGEQIYNSSTGLILYYRESSMNCTGVLLE